MKEIELVVRISEEDLDCIKYLKAKGWASKHELQILNGTPLPKGHGRILDEKDILDTENNDGGLYDLVDMPEYIAGVKAIIEADKEQEE